MALYSIASADSVTITGGLTLELSGSATVNSILGVKDGQTLLIYPTGAFAFGSSGNILAGSAAQTVGTWVALAQRSGVLIQVGRDGYHPKYPVSRKRTTSAFDKSSSTALSDITGLTVNVDAGLTYEFSAILYTTSDAGGGVKFAIGGTCTATAFICEAITSENGVTSKQDRTTTKGNAVGGITAVTVALCRIVGTITVANAGTLTAMMAQNSSIAANSTVLALSSFGIDREVA